MADTRFVKNFAPKKDPGPFPWFSMVFPFAFSSFVAVAEGRVGPVSFYTFALFTALVLIPHYLGIDPKKKAGDKGENDLIASLNSQLGNGYSLINNVRIPYKRSKTGEREIDIIVVGEKKVFIIEVKSFSGTLTSDNVMDKSWSLERKRGRGRVSVRNPVRQAFGQMLALRSQLDRYKLSVPIESAVFMNGDAVDLRLGKTTDVPIFTSVSALSRWVESEDTGRGMPKERDRVIDRIIQVDHARSSF